jgi:endonuclease/exonuclease/phosphatase family metal-dependent hydrolase
MKEAIPIKNSKWLYFFIVAINMFFGLEILKVFLSLLVNFFRERPNISLTDVGIYAAVTFILVFATAFLYRLRYGAILWVLSAGIGTIRLVLQVNSWPTLSLAASALGTILWMASFVFFISLIQQKKIGLLSTFFPGIIFGISIATAISGLFGTWDMIWRQDWYITFAVLLVMAAKLWIVYRIYPDMAGTRPSDGDRSIFYTLIVFMPFIFLQLLKFQNIASFDAVTGNRISVSLAVMLLSNIAAFAFIFIFSIRKARIPITVLSVLFLLLSFWPDITGYLYILQVIFGNIGAFWLLIVVLDKSSVRSLVKTPWKDTSAAGIGGLIFFIFAFIYYGSYDISLPFGNWLIPVVMAALISICALFSSCIKSAPFGSTGARNINQRFTSIKPAFLYLTIALLIVPLIIFLPPKNIDRDTYEEEPVRVMDYNIHQGFNIKGFLDLESIARVIENSGADVVCLQEVSRGWVINGSADTLLWLSDRLDMHYLFMPASDAVWGNAVLSHYPLKLIKSGYLPQLGSPLRRSYLISEVELEGQENINVMCVHIHHVKGEGAIREEQVEKILEEWDGLKRTAIMGDFNAEIYEPEIKKMYDAGLIDSQLELGEEEKLTWVHYEPYRRIDYIWVTKDLEISEVDVPYSTASDHLPVVVNIN